MWFCGGGGTGAHGGDSIWYSESHDFGRWSSWSTPVEVVRPSNNNSYLDYSHACDPSVIRDGLYYYVLYTGAADWRPNGGSCIGSASADGCDNRIFAARVPVASTADRYSYSKLVNVGECALSSCFQWRSYWSGSRTEYPPVPGFRYEVGPVWRRAGTGIVGYTSQQTRAYGIGQPSQLHVFAWRTWFTSVTEDSASEKLWIRPYTDLGNAFAMQDQNSFQQRTTSNLGNEVNYEVAYVTDPSVNRYVVTVAEEYPDPANPLGRPRVHAAQYPGFDTSQFNPPVMSNNLSNNVSPTACGCFVAGETAAHNSGFLRDEYGYLASMPGHSGGQPYYWVYYGNNRDKFDPGQLGSVNINRVPFTLSQ